MRHHLILFLFAASAFAGADHSASVRFQTSDRCIACHNGLTSSSGEDVSIGYAWRASIMANASRDPYWQASVRREAMDHPEAAAKVQDDCSICHMPIPRYEAKLKGKSGEIFSHIPFDAEKTAGREAADGVTCSVCHQISAENFGKPESYNGNFIITPSQGKNVHPEYGPFDIEQGQQHIMHSSSQGFLPQSGPHIRDAELCATCHTLITDAIGPNGKVVGKLPEQMPYEEWLHSDYRNQQSCQQCHMPEVTEAAPIAHVLGVPRQGLHRHTFIAANFLMTDMLNRYRDDLQTAALPNELSSNARAIVDYLQSNAARVSIATANLSSGNLVFDIHTENLGGHKLPTAYPARRAWLHVTVRDRNDALVFESGKLHPDGSIEGNDNDANPDAYEPYYSEITRPDQVQIYESILGDSAGKVTTGLLSAVGYLKDDRILPHGFNKATAVANVAVVGGAYDDPNFNGQGSRVRYRIALGNAPGPFHITAELWYQPIGFRWAHNLDRYSSANEPARFTRYYDSMATSNAVVLAHAETTR